MLNQKCDRTIALGFFHLHPSKWSIIGSTTCDHPVFSGCFIGISWKTMSVFLFEWAINCKNICFFSALEYLWKADKIVPIQSITVALKLNRVRSYYRGIESLYNQQLQFYFYVSIEPQETTCPSTSFSCLLNTAGNLIGQCHSKALLTC